MTRARPAPSPALLPALTHSGLAVSPATRVAAAFLTSPCTGVRSALQLPLLPASAALGERCRTHALRDPWGRMAKLSVASANPVVPGALGAAEVRSGGLGLPAGEVGRCLYCERDSPKSRPGDRALPWQVAGPTACARPTECSRPVLGFIFSHVSLNPQRHLIHRQRR